jgi:hypothetical protein
VQNETTFCRMRQNELARDSVKHLVWPIKSEARYVRDHTRSQAQASQCIAGNANAQRPRLAAANDLSVFRTERVDEIFQRIISFRKEARQMDEDKRAKLEARIARYSNRW